MIGVFLSTVWALSLDRAILYRSGEEVELMKGYFKKFSVNKNGQSLVETHGIL